MDGKQAWSRTVTGAKSARQAGRRVLDATSPKFAPLAARWDAAAERRHELRTPENLRALMTAQREQAAARVLMAQARHERARARKHAGMLSGARRSAARADRAATQNHRAARKALRDARRNYPKTLRQRAIEAHAAHTVPAGIGSWILSGMAHHLTVWPVATSAGLIAANLGALWLGRREVRDVFDDGLSIEERQLMERLNPSYWVQHADERGLSGTVTTPPQMTAAGIHCEVRLDGTWTAKALADKADQVRNLLGARAGLRIEIKAGSRGAWAVLMLRTRSAADGDDLKWSMAATSFGVDTITGDLVDVPLGERMLIAGRSGAGKSVASRPLLWKASEGETNALVIIDLKKVEGRLWDHRARVASTPEEVAELVQELVDEMTERLDVLPKGQAALVPTARRPRITVVVDEGAEVMSACQKVEIVVGCTDKGKPIIEKVNALDGLDSIARMGRAPAIDLWWMTQSPTYGDGVPRQIAKQLGTRIGLQVESPAEARVVFGEDAQAKGWNADTLPAPGVAYLRHGRRGPNPIAVRHMTDDQVIALPSRPIWSRFEVPATVPAGRPALRLVPPLPADDAAPVADTVTNRDRVIAAVHDGATTAKAVAEATGLHKGTVSREIKTAIKAGELLRGDDNTLTAASAVKEA